MSVFLTPSVDRTSCARGDDAEGCVYEAWSKLPPPPPSMIVQTERSYLRSAPLLSGQYVCVLLNTGAVCGQIFTRCWKGRFFRPPWAVFSWGSVISRNREGEAAVRSLQRRIGETRCQCALNTSCVDHGALMSTLWNLFSWHCSRSTNFCFTKTFVTLSLVL